MFFLSNQYQLVGLLQDYQNPLERFGNQYNTALLSPGVEGTPLPAFFFSPFAAPSNFFFFPSPKKRGRSLHFSPHCNGARNLIP